MTWVKICGMTNLNDALVAVEAGADAVGFVFHPSSPRNVKPENVASIVPLLPAETEKVGVFVGDSVGGIESKRRIVHQARLTAIQAYSAPSIQTLKDWLSLNIKVIVAWPADRIIRGRLGGSKWRTEAKGKIRAILIDSGSREQMGGTGKAFDWVKAATVLSAIDGFDFVAAGGLTPENVSGAIQTLKPWGVDVVSGVEASPGKKDPEKVRAFVRAVREMDRRVG
ncbi:MAG: phosphoribosylanthranilate isomerase [Candidatus Sulfotelmatobacter sp.]